jgi:hypothetical protein
MTEAELERGVLYRIVKWAWPVGTAASIASFALFAANGLIYDAAVQGVIAASMVYIWNRDMR